MADIIFLGMPLQTILLFFLALALVLFLARLSYVLIRRALDERISRRSSKLAARSIEYVIVALGIYWTLLAFFGVDNLTAFAASLGIVGIAVAFASQQIIQNMMAGVLIGMERRIQMEDWIEIGGSPETKAARVRDITLTKTVLLEPSGRLIYVPNAVIVSSKIINYTKSGFVEVALPLKVPCSEDLEKLRRIIFEVIDLEERILPNVAKPHQEKVEGRFSIPSVRRLFDNQPPLETFKPRVLVSEIDDSDVVLSMRFWIMEVKDKDEIVSSFLDNLLRRIMAEGVRLSSSD